MKEVKRRTDMAERKTSFPSVLDKYGPAEPAADDEGSNAISKTTTGDDTDGAPHHPSPAESAMDTEKQQKRKVTSQDKSNKPLQHVSSSSNKHPHHHNPRSQMKREQTNVSMMSAGRKSRMRKQEEEHFEHVAEVWGQARSEVLTERHQQLQEKVQLQHQLVKAQERRSDLIRQEDQERQARKRQKQKEEKQAKEAALRDICKQSLDADKKAAAEQRRAAKQSNTQSLTTSRTTSVHSDRSLSDGSDHNGHGQTSPLGASKPGRHRGYLPSKRLPEYQLPSTPMKELEGEEDQEFEEVFPERPSPSSKSSEGGEAAVPRYQQQLYQMYGKQADYFLHPKPVQPPPAARASHRRNTQAKLKTKKGHIGASELWETLRKDSMCKLIRNDQKFPLELKSTFSAFVRERLTNHGKPVQRSFCATEDVPDIAKLMDQSKLRQTRMYRHKTELMYRSSVINEDRTSILLHNSPLPDITEAGGQPDSISRYLQSWADDQSDASEADYMKWIKAKGEGQGDQRMLDNGGEEGDNDQENVRHSAHSRQLSETTNELHNIWHSIASRKKKPRTPRYHFLTEKETECEGGEFTQRHQQEKGMKEMPQRRYVNKSHSALDFVTPHIAHTGEARGRSALAGQLHRYRSDWEPLSLHALVEYKKQVTTDGVGDFDNGRIKMWPAAVSAST